MYLEAGHLGALLRIIINMCRGQLHPQYIAKPVYKRYFNTPKFGENQDVGSCVNRVRLHQEYHILELL